MKHVIDRELTGKRFGRWTVVGLESRGPNGGSCRWSCVCECGTLRVLPGKYINREIVNGTNRSCGCWAKENSSRVHLKHGLSKLPEHKVWSSMRSRCLLDTRYSRRGIKVCQRWMDSFTAFFEDMGPRPGPGYSIERKNNNGNYEPGNCIWATAMTQARNRGSSVFIVHNGQKKTLQEWADSSGIKRETISYRLKHGWTIEEALGTLAWMR